MRYCFQIQDRNKTATHASYNRVLPVTERVGMLKKKKKKEENYSRRDTDQIREVYC